MPDPREDAEFARIRLASELEKSRHIVAQYEEHQAYYRRQIEQFRYRLGRLDERLGDVA